MAIAASLLVAVAGYAAVKNMPQLGGNQVVNNGGTPEDKGSAQSPVGNARKLYTPEEKAALDRKIAAANQGITVEELMERERKAEERRAQEAQKPKQPAIASSQPEIRVDSNPAIPFAASSTQPKDDSPGRSESGNGLAGGKSTSSSDNDVIAYINEMIRKQWVASGVEPSAVATDGEWFRRVFLDMLGRIPSVEETVRLFCRQVTRTRRPGWSTGCSTRTTTSKSTPATGRRSGRTS